MKQKFTNTLNYRQKKQRKTRCFGFLRGYIYIDDWWECTYDDAKSIGLKITSFGLDRNRHAKGEFLASAPECAESIIKEHGETCETYKTAKAYLQSLEQLDLKYPYADIDARAEAYDDEREELDREFLKLLLEDYSILLQRESEYLQSRDYAEDCITANAYTFTEDGSRFG